MTVTLQPVLEALGYRDAQQQRAVIKLLQASGSFGDVKGVNGMLTDQQADAILTKVTYNDAAQAANILHEITQEHMIRRTRGEDWRECEESVNYKLHRPELLEAIKQAGLFSSTKPTLKYYDHVLIPGAMEGEVDSRFDTLQQLWDQGVRFGKIYILGSERALNEGREPSAHLIGANGSEMKTEMGMMETSYYKKSASWPKDMQDVRIFEVDTYNKANGERANTQDTIKAWEKTQPSPGGVLVVSSQPYTRYQDAAVKSVLPESYKVETVGEKAPYDLKISLAMEAIARQIDVGFPKLLAKLQMQQPKLQTSLVSLDPAQIQVDAPTYQFRSGGDANGVTNAGRYHSERWDSVIHGDPILVHERLDGTIFVADGHHRVDLAKKLNQVGTGPGKISAMVLREADGYTAKDVKIIAAYKNIAHGQTDMVDTARVFKEASSPDVHKELLPSLQMDKGNLRMSYSLSKLSDNLLDKVAIGEVPAPIAANLAERIPYDYTRQEQVVNTAMKKWRQNIVPATPKELREMSFTEKLASQRAELSSLINLTLTGGPSIT